MARVGLVQGPVLVERERGLLRDGLRQRLQRPRDDLLDLFFCVCLCVCASVCGWTSESERAGLVVQQQDSVLPPSTPRLIHGTYLVEDDDGVALALGHVLKQQRLDGLHVRRDVGRHVRVAKVLPPQHQQPPRPLPRACVCVVSAVAVSWWGWAWTGDKNRLKSQAAALSVPAISVLVSMARAMTCAVSVLPTPVGPVKAVGFGRSVGVVTKGKVNRGDWTTLLLSHWLC